MGDSRWHHVATLIDQTDADVPQASRICTAGLGLLGVTTLSIALVIDGTYAPMGSSSTLGASLDDQQFAIGDGPTFAAVNSIDPILAEDLLDHASTVRWPLFSSVAPRDDARAIFAFPLRIGAANLGVMSAYRAQPGALTSEQFTYGLVLATFAGAEIVRSLSGQPELAEQAIDPLSYDQSTVQFAVGMIAERFSISIVDALVRLRAHAFTRELTVTEVARMVVAGRIVLDL